MNINYKIFNALHLKLIAAFLMLLNHLSYVYNFLPDSINSLFLIVSRCVAPLFAFMLVEGVIHSKNIKKYIIRVATWTVVVTLGNIVISRVLLTLAKGSVDLDMQKYLQVNTNITYTILLGLLFLVTLKKLENTHKRRKVIYIVLCVVLFVAGFIVEWGVVFMPFLFVTYKFKGNLKKSIIGYSVVELIAILFNSEYLYFLVFPLIYLYNGKSGSQKARYKYFFYIFYPLHLWLIIIINYLILS